MESKAAEQPHGNDCIWPILLKNAFRTRDCRQRFSAASDWIRC